MPADDHNQCALLIEHHTRGPMSYHALWPSDALLRDHVVKLNAVVQ